MAIFLIVFQSFMEQLCKTHLGHNLPCCLFSRLGKNSESAFSIPRAYNITVSLSFLLQGLSPLEEFYKTGFPKNFAKCTGKHLCRSFVFVKFQASSYQRCSVKKGVLKIFAKLTRKHLSQSLSFNKVAGLRSYILHLGLVFLLLTLNK